MDNKSISHTRWKCQYHIVFIPKYRKKVLYEGWFKYVDETYHIENDNLHYLDVRQFEIVPNFIIKMWINIWYRMRRIKNY